MECRRSFDHRRRTDSALILSFSSPKLHCVRCFDAKKEHSCLVLVQEVQTQPAGRLVLKYLLWGEHGLRKAIDTSYRLTAHSCSVPVKRRHLVFKVFSILFLHATYYARLSSRCEQKKVCEGELLVKQLVVIPFSVTVFRTGRRYPSVTTTTLQAQC